MDDYLSDNAVIQQIGQRIKRVRLDKNVSQQALADNAGISKRTLERFEAGNSIQLTLFLRILRALNLLENIHALVPEPGISPIIALKMQGKEKKRASKSRKPPTPKQWEWGDDQ